MLILPLRSDLAQYLDDHHLLVKWQKAFMLFEKNMRHPSLHTELLEPHWRGIYSFRLDRTYRALFFMTAEGCEVFQITNHYKK